MTFKQSFEWHIDMGTTPDYMQVIKVTAGGDMVKQRLLPFFTAFKYYKLGAVTIRMVPASTLPVDPTGLSYEAGENTVDPRDQFNPGLVRITNGEDFYENPEFFQLKAPAEDVFHSMMYDRRWFKFSLQSGMKRRAYPKYWKVGQLHQDMFPGTHVNLPTRLEDEKYGETFTMTQYNGGGELGHPFTAGSDPRGLFQTGGLEPLGWMPTDAALPPLAPNDVYQTPSIASVPEVELMKIVLPMAYKTRFFYRIYIQEEVYFREPVAMGVNNYSQLDRFLRPDYRWLLPNVSIASRPYPTTYPHNQGDGE